MAVKTKKKSTKAKTRKKTATAGKARKTSPATKSKIKKGARYACDVCGIAVSVDEVCGCVDVCDIICCGEQMTPQR